MCCRRDLVREKWRKGKLKEEEILTGLEGLSPLRVVCTGRHIAVLEDMSDYSTRARVVVLERQHLIHPLVDLCMEFVRDLMLVGVLTPDHMCAKLPTDLILNLSPLHRPHTSTRGPTAQPYGFLDVDSACSLALSGSVLLFPTGLCFFILIQVFSP